MIMMIMDHNAAVGDDTDFSDHVDMFVFVEKWPKAVGRIGHF